jgi:hypothetical protein
MINKSAPEEFPLDEIDLLVGWRAGEDEYLFIKAVAMVREWLLARRRRIAFVMKRARRMAAGMFFERGRYLGTYLEDQARFLNRQLSLPVATISQS